MTNDQKKVLKMVIEARLGGTTTEPPNGNDGKGLIMKVLGLSVWPPSGFDLLSRDIIYRSIANEWPEAMGEPSTT